jgi:hypothetical protein
MLLTSCILLATASADAALSIERQGTSGFNLDSGINAQWTITGQPAGNTTNYAACHLDEQTVPINTQAPHRRSFNTNSYPQGQPTPKPLTHTFTGETAAISEQRISNTFPYITIISVLLFAGIVFAFTLLFTWYIIRKKAMTRRIKSKIAGDTEHSSRR